MENTASNTDKEIWRKVPDDYYSPRIFVTKEGAIGIAVGGFVVVGEVEWWHRLGQSERGFVLP